MNKKIFFVPFFFLLTRSVIHAGPNSWEPNAFMGAPWDAYDNDDGSQESTPRQSPTIDEIMHGRHENLDWGCPPPPQDPYENTRYEPELIIPPQTLVQDWHDNNRARFDAYQKTAQSGNQQFYYEHALSYPIKTFLQKNGVEYKNYAKLQGNTLQHELLDEIIAGLERTACVRPATWFHDILITESVSLFEEARICNQMGDCITSSKLIDFASSLIDCCFAALQGAAQGVLQGATSAVTGTCHLVAHPVQSAQALGQAAAQLVKLVHEYVPSMNLVEFAATENGYKEYHRKLVRVEQNWQQLYAKLKQCWKTKPTADLLRDISESVAHTATNIIVGNACIGLLTRASLVAVEEIRILQQSKVLATAGEDLPQFFANMSEIDQAKMPATMFFNEAQTLSGKNLGTISPYVIEEAVKYVMSNKVVHIFEKTEHNLQPLVAQLGDQENTVRAILNAAHGKLPARGIFKDIPVTINGFTVYIRGSVVDGVPKIGTFFIK